MLKTESLIKWACSYSNLKPYQKTMYPFYFSDQPFNPYVNTGGIMSAALLLQKVKPELIDLPRKYEYVYNIFQKMAGGELVQFNNVVFLSEKTCMDRDFSLAYFMRENKCFPPGADINKILELYFQVNKFQNSW